MKKKRHLLRVAVYLLLNKDGKTLLARRFQTGYEDGNYSLPAGHVEPDETVTDALVRETLEEIGIDLDKNSLQMKHVLYRSKKSEDVEYIDFFFSADAWIGTVENKESDKCDDLSWFAQGEFPKNIISYISHVFDQISRDEPFSEYLES